MCSNALSFMLDWPENSSRLIETVVFNHPRISDLTFYLFVTKNKKMTSLASKFFSFFVGYDSKRQNGEATC